MGQYHNQMHQQQIPNRSNNPQTARMQQQFAEEKGGIQLKYQNDPMMIPQQGSKYNFETQDPNQTVKTPQERFNLQQQQQAMQQFKQLPPEQQALLQKQIQQHQKLHQQQSQQLQQINPSQIPSQTQSQAQSLSESKSQSQLQAQRQPQPQSQSQAQFQFPQQQQRLSQTQFAQYQQQHLSQTLAQLPAKRIPSDGAGGDNFPIMDIKNPTSSVKQAQANDQGSYEKNFKPNLQNPEGIANQGRLMHTQQGMSRPDMSYLPKRPQSQQGAQFPSSSQNFQNTTTNSDASLNKTQNPYLERPSLQFQSMQPSNANQVTYTPKSVIINQPPSLSVKYLNKTLIAPNFQRQYNLPQNEINSISKPQSQLAIQQQISQRGSQPGSQPENLQPSSANIPQNDPHHNQTSSITPPIQDRLQQVIRSLNLQSNTESADDILAKLPPDVINSLKNPSQSSFENMLIPKNNILGGKRDLNLNQSLVRDSKLINPPPLGYNFLNRSSGSFPSTNNSQNIAGSNPIFQINGILDTKSMPGDAVSIQLSQKSMSQRNPQKDNEMEGSFKSPEKAKHRKLRKIASQMPTATKRSESESEMTSEYPPSFDPMTSETSNNKTDAEFIPKRGKIKKRKIVDSDDDDFDRMLEKKEDEDYYGDEKRKYVKKSVTNKYMVPTHRSQKEDSINSAKKKGAIQPTASSRREFPIAYSELVKSLAVLEKLECVEDFQNLKLLPVKRGKCVSNPFYEILRETSGIAFWFYICAEYFPKVPFIQNSIDQLFDSREEGLKMIQLEFCSRVSKAIKRLEGKDRSGMKEDEKQLYETICGILKRKEAEIENTELSNPLLQNLPLETAYKNEYTLADDQWILEIRALANNFIQKAAGLDCSNKVNVLKKIDLSDLIKILENECVEHGEKNTKNINALKTKAKEEIKSEALFFPQNVDPDYIFMDLKVKLQEEESYISFLEKKQIEGLNAPAVNPNDKESKQVTSSKRSRANSEDIVCQICNDGESADDNPIVFCSKCNVSVHQLCYGITSVPQDDWICELCQEFGASGRYMRCPLCPNRAGALKPTALSVRTSLFQNSNPEFHRYLMSFAYSSDLVKSKPKSATRFKRDEEASKSKLKETDLQKILLAQDNEEEMEEENKENLYYDYHELGKSSSDCPLQDEPKPAQAWAHITCAKYISELFFQDEASLSAIDGFRKLDFQRFEYECCVCGKKNVGATVSCEKNSCKKRFHPECARKANLALEIKEIEVPQQFGNFIVAEPREVQVIYCEKHRPLKLKGQLESRDKKEREEIYKFCKVIEKTYQINVAEQNAFKESLVEQPQQPEATILQTVVPITSAKKKKSQPEMEIDHFLQQVEELKKIIPAPKHLIYLERKESFSIHPETNEQVVSEHYEVTDTEVIMPDPSRKLTSKDEIWHYIDYKDFNPLQKFNRYQRLRNAAAATAVKNIKETRDDEEDFKQEEEVLPMKVSRRYMKSTTSLAQKCNKSQVKSEANEKFFVKNDPQPLQPAKSQVCYVCSEGMVKNLDYQPITKCYSCDRHFHFRCVNIKSDNLKWLCTICIDEPARDAKIEEEIQRIETRDDPNDLENQVDLPDIYSDNETSNNSERLRNPYVTALEGEGQQIEKVMIEFEGLFPRQESNLTNQQESLF